MDGGLVILANTIYSNKIQKMIVYLIIGMLLTGYIDYYTQMYDIEEAKLTGFEFVIFILLWPIVVLVIIYELLKEKFAQKMLDEKLDFLPLEESLLLKEAGIEVKTKFSWVCSIEEIGDEFETSREFAEAAIDFYGEDEIEVGYDNHAEFTYDICPAPTYIDLIK